MSTREISAAEKKVGIAARRVASPYNEEKK